MRRDEAIGRWFCLELTKDVSGSLLLVKKVEESGCSKENEGGQE